MPMPNFCQSREENSQPGIEPPLPCKLSMQWTTRRWWQVLTDAAASHLEDYHRRQKGKAATAAAAVTVCFSLFNPYHRQHLLASLDAHGRSGTLSSVSRTVTAVWRERLRHLALFPFLCYVTVPPRLCCNRDSLSVAILLRVNPSSSPRSLSHP